MAQQDRDDLYNENPKDTTYTGSDLPHGDGTVAPEDVDKIDGSDKAGKKTGQDHSTENREDQMPRDGVGAIQDSNLIKENVARIEDEE